MRKIACFLVLVLGGCSTTITTVDGNKQVDQLTPSDDEQLCKDIAGYVENSFSADDLAKIACGFASTSGDSCQADFESCVANSHVTITPIVDASDCAGFTAALKKCDATVDQFTTCVQEMVGALEQLESELPVCSQAAEQQALVSLEGSFSADCIQLLDKCQILFGSSTSSSGGSSSGGSSF
jgi:hypothetical protein